MSDPVLELDGLTKHFEVDRGLALWRRRTLVRAVDGVSFSVRRGETYALVGESGCGKSTTGRMALRLLQPTSGDVRFEGRSIYALDRHELRRLRREMQIVFQDPYGSLNPRLSARRILEEPLQVQGISGRVEREARIGELLRLVGLSTEHAGRFPHEFSGGQRQRIAIARALAARPRLIVCDEPVSALDVSIQAQIVNLLKDLQRRFGLMYLFIAHDLAVVKHISDRVGVMYLGRLVEEADKRSIFVSPRHPYTQGLIEAVPLPNPRARREHAPIAGDLPNPLQPPSGCHFHPRCPYAVERCRRDAPLLETAAAGHRVACHRHAEIPSFQPRVVAVDPGDTRFRHRLALFDAGRA
ncbi:MAG: ABC transporter ATP-binding protein [Reyranellaceae bacterium]